MQCIDKIRVVDKGEFVDIKPLMELKIDYPKLGAAFAYSIGHPEPITLKNNISLSGRCINALVLPRETVALLKNIQEDVYSGKIDIFSGAKILRNLGKLDKERSTRINKIKEKLPENPHLPGLFAFAKGKKDGKNARAVVRITDIPAYMLNESAMSMSGATAMPMSLALRKFLNERTASGIYTAEEFFDISNFFTELAPYYLQARYASTPLIESDFEFDKE